MEIYLIRHTPPKIETGICYGQTDLPVDENFSSDFENIKNKIPQSVDTIYSSPLIRCKVLAEELLKRSDNRLIHFDERIKELNFGKWEMKKWESIDHLEFEHWESDLLNYNIPGGECLFAMQNRVTSFIDDLLNQKNGKVLIITHAGVIRCFLSRFKNISLLDTLRIPVEYSTIHTLQIIE
jgi:alpha-ribazole phosphatase